MAGGVIHPLALDCTAARYALDGVDPPPPVTWRTRVIVVLLAAAGGVLGIIGAFVSEVRSGNLLLLPVLGAPVIEEALKPIGVYLGLVWFRRALRSQLFIATLCALGGLTFGAVEALVYLYVYVPDHSGDFALYRWTLPLILHTTASFIVGLGVSPRIVEWVNYGTPLPKRTVRFYIAGVVIHAVFNTVTVALYLTGLDFE